MSTVAVKQNYPNGPRQTNFTDVLTGASQTGVAKLVPLVPAGITLAKVLLVATVTATSGVTEVVGDSYCEKHNVAFNGTTGTLAVLPQVEGTPFVAATASMAGCTFGSAVSGANAEVTYGTGSTLDASTVVAITISIIEEGVVG
jgi:hypothetical protein